MIAAEVLEPGTNLFGVFGAADVIILGIVLASAAIGFWSGFIWMLVLVASMVACIWVTLVYHPVVARAFGSHFTQPMRLMGSAAAVFIGAILVCYLVAFLFRDIINALKPQLADRILGAVFGVILGGLLSSFFCFLVLAYAEKGAPVRPYVERSVPARAMGTCFRYALPDRLRRVVDETADKVAD